MSRPPDGCTNFYRFSFRRPAGRLYGVPGWPCKAAWRAAREPITLVVQPPGRAALAACDGFWAPAGDSFDPSETRAWIFLGFVRGWWLNYFRMASTQGKLKELDGWPRNRLRYCIWHHWKKSERKRKNLIQLAVDQDHAYSWSRTRMGGWAVAQSPILITTIILERLCKRGFEALLSYYEKIAPHLNEPLYTRTVLQWCEEGLPVSLSGGAVYSIVHRNL